MTDLRSGLCHGPDCAAPLTDRSASWLFCRQECQMAWHASLALPPMPSMSIHLPSPNMARWTSEGGAPVTPETSTWTPRPDALGRYARDRWDEEGVDRWAPDLPITDPGPIRTRLSIVVQLDDADHPDWAWTDVTAHVADAQPGETVELGMPRRPSTTPTLPSSIQVRLVETGEVLFDGPVEPWPEVGEAATQSPIQEGSWLSRLQGWLCG